MDKKRVLVMNLTPRWWMLHYSSQFCNELSKNWNIIMKVWIASYHKSTLYNKEIDFIKVRTNPNLFSFVLDTINIFYHTYFLLKILQFKPDIVHFLDNHPWYMFYGRVFKLLWYKIYVTQHDPILHSWENKWMLWTVTMKVNGLLRNISDKFMVHGNNLRKEVLKTYKLDERKVLSIKHWAYTFFNKWARWLETKKNCFLFFWRIVDYKWLDVLLESLKIVKEKVPDFNLIIAGPWKLDKYKELLSKYKNNISIYNYNIEPEDTYKFFEISEFVVLPYKDATWSWVIPIAYSFSKAVLVSDVWELTSVVKEGETGSVITANNSELLWEKIVEMLQEKSKIIEQWKNWKMFSDNHLSWKEIIDRIYI